MSKKIQPTKKGKPKPVRAQHAQISLNLFNRTQAIVLMVLSFFLYFNTLRHELAFDDAIVISENTATQKGFKGIGELLRRDMFDLAGKETGELTGGRYRPLSLISFAIEAQLFGSPKTDANGVRLNAPDGSPLYAYKATTGHWVNVLCYVLSVFLLYRLLCFWFESKPELGMVPFVASLIFLVHPVHSEVVANIKSRDEILSLLLLLGALILWHKSRSKKGISAQLILGAILYFLSMFSKETTFTYVALFPVISLVIYRKKAKQMWTDGALFWVAALLYLVIRTSMFGLPKTAVSTTGIMDNPFAQSDTTEKLGTVALICWRYLLLLIAPVTMRSDYSYQHVPLVGFGHPEAIAGVLAYLALFLIALRGWQKHSLFTLAIGMFFMPLVITTNLLFNIGAPMGERFLFIPSVGYALGLACLIGILFQIREMSDFKLKWPVAGVLSLYLIYLGALTFARNPDWKNNDILFAHDVKTTPKSAKIQNYQARRLLAQWQEQSPDGRDNTLLIQARDHYKESVKLYPYFQISWYDLGLVNLYLNDGPAAVEALQACLNLNNTHGMTRELMAQVQYRLMKDYQKAADHLRYAVEKSDRRSANTLKDLAIYYAQAGKRDSAALYIGEAVKMAPEDVQIIKNAGVLYMQAGRTEEGQKLFQRAAEIEQLQKK